MSWILIFQPLCTGDCGIEVDLPEPVCNPTSPFSALFAEELGLVIEVDTEAAGSVSQQFESAGVPCRVIGKVGNTAG